MRGDIAFGLLELVLAAGLSALRPVMRPARPAEPEHDDLRRGDDGAAQDPGEGLGSASYWPTT